jgi:phosphoribosylamine--glycine ligase
VSAGGGIDVLVLGGGGREHALVARIARSPQVGRVLCAPGNGGTAAIARNLALDPEDPAAVVAAAKAHAVGLVVVGPEGPLVAGVADALREAGIDVFGPSQAAARLEGSKVWSKRFMLRHGVPTAPAESFDDADAAIAHARAAGVPLVVKADGLAAGKGVIVPGSVDETVDAIERIMRRREVGAAGSSVLLEHMLVGQEVSYHVVIDGSRFVALAPAQDHKRVRDGDQGPNTGGMGAYSPPPIVTPEIERKILERVVKPTLAGLATERLEYRGALFIGLMIVDGEPLVIEYNARFGDPETQVLLARLGGDVMPLLLGAARGDLSSVQLSWEAKAAMCVVLAAPGYPGGYPKGAVIEGLVEAAAVPGVEVLHAGTRVEGGRVLTAGGRVLGVTARGGSVDEAADRAYTAAARVRFDGVHYRRDIGHHARGAR